MTVGEAVLLAATICGNHPSAIVIAHKDAVYINRTKNDPGFVFWRANEHPLTKEEFEAELADWLGGRV